MILGVSRLATVRAIVLAKHSPKRNVGADELVVRLYLSLVDRPIALAPKIVGLAIDQTIVHNYTLIHIKLKELVHGYIQASFGS